MKTLKNFVIEAKGFSSLAIYSSIFQQDQLSINVFGALAPILLEHGIKYAKKIEKYQTEMRPLIEDYFLPGFSSERESVIGLRYGSNPSKWDAFAQARLFGVPLVLHFAGKIKSIPVRQPKLPESEKDLIFVGGWRPLREVEMLLRDKPFIFGIKEGEAVHIPNPDELEKIRRDYQKRVNWAVVYRKKSGKIEWYEPELKSDDTLLSDLAIITVANSPLNLNKRAFAVSGTHKEGGVGASYLLSNMEYLDQFTIDEKIRNMGGKNYQALVRILFRNYDREAHPRSLKVKDFEIIDVISL